MSSDNFPQAPEGHDHLEIDALWTVRILNEFIAREVGRTGKRRVVVGLSGGIDSAVSAYLACPALSPKNVTCLLMPYRTSSESSIADAGEIVEQLGCASETIDITPIIEGFSKTSGEVDRLRLGNMMARTRMTLLFDRSAALDALVLGTSNKTELLLGYGTLHGDLASALNPLGDLYKTQVRILAESLDVPEPVRSKPPSADLWPDQSDEDELGYSYERIDRLLALLIDVRASRETACEVGFPRSMIDDVVQRVVRSQFKRRQPVIAKVSLRSVGWDFRYPRDWLS
jgi:NAD+ synthase